MAANINLHQPRVEVALTEHDANNTDPAAPDGQANPQPESSIAAPTDQQGQSSGDGSSSGGNSNGTHDPVTVPPPPVEVEAATSFPASFRYGLGEVSIGRPDYIRSYAERAQPDAGEPGVHEPTAREPNARVTAFAPTPRAENTPPPATTPATPAPTTASTKPTPMPKPGGEAAEEPLSSNRTPYLYPGLHTQPDQSPHYANALAYGREHGYKDDEVMKLAVLMQANHDNDKGAAWLSLKPEVLRAAVNAVVRNPDNSFDTSGVFGGQRGYHYAGFASQTIPPQGGTAVDENPVAFESLVPPEGWVLEERDTGGGDAGPNIIRYYRPSDELIARNDIPYMPMLMSGYVQVPRGLESELSVGADGGVHDLSRLDFHPDYGLVTTSDNIRPLDNEDGLEQLVVTAILGVATYGIATAAAGGVAALNSSAGLLSSGALSAAEALALSSFVGTTAATGDLRQGFIAGLASFAGSQVARFVVGPQGLQLNVNPNTPWTMGNFVSSIVSGTVSGGIQGDWRRGLVNGLVSFSSNVIAHELKIPATVASAAIRSLYDPQGALNGFITDLMTNPASVLGNTGGTRSSDVAAQREAAIQELMAQGMNLEHANLAVDRIMVEATRLNTVTAQARAETQQQITWMRDAIDGGYTETAAGFFNNLMAQAAAENPNKPRAEIANQLMQALGIVPNTIGFVVGVDGRVTVDRFFVRGDPDADDTTANDLRTRNMMERIRAFNPNSSESALRTEAERAIRLENSTSGIGQLRPELSNNEIRQIALGLETDRERIQAYADRLAAIPEGERAFALTDIKNEMAQQMGGRLNEALGIVPLPGMEPMTQQQLLRMVDVALGILPVTGEASAFYELIYGRSPASQEEASRLWAAFGVVTAGYGRLGGRLMTAEQRAARELDYMGGGNESRWNRKPSGRQDAGATLASELGAPPAGIVSPEAHHIAGFGIADGSTQTILNRFGITPNSVENGIWLSAEQHAMTFGNIYKDWVAGQLVRVTSREEAVAALNVIKDTLRNLKPGTAPPWRTGK